MPEKSYQTKLNERQAQIETKLIEVRSGYRKTFSVGTFLVSTFSTVAVFCLSIINSKSQQTVSIFEVLLVFLGIPLIVGVIIGFLVPLIAKLRNRLDEKALLEELSLLGSEQLQNEIQEDFFTNLVKINFKYIDKYYLQTQIQADRSFTISLISAIVAFLIIICGITLMFYGKVNSAYIAAGTGILSEFISAVFFYLYNRTTIKMGEYHQKLVLTQNISLALKITEQMPLEDKIKAQTMLIEQLTKDVNLHLVSRKED